MSHAILHALLDKVDQGTFDTSPPTRLARRTDYREKFPRGCTHRHRPASSARHRAILESLERAGVPLDVISRLRNILAFSVDPM